MNKYSEWTDEQINIEVADRQGLCWYSRPCSNSENKWMFSKNSNEFQRDNEVELPDYCNDWGAAGPLMQEMEIFIDWDDKEVFCLNYSIEAFDFKGKERALRAAMETYLLMGDSEQWKFI